MTGPERCRFCNDHIERESFDGPWVHIVTGLQVCVASTFATPRGAR